MNGVCELRAVRLPGDRPVAEVVRAFRGDRGLVCLRGDWAGGSDLIVSEPVSVHCGGPEVLPALGRVPRVHGEPPGERCVGGGWFGLLDYPTGRALHGLPDGPAEPEAGLGDAGVDEAGVDEAGLAARSWLGFYDHVLRWDRAEQAWWFEALWCPERAAELAARQRLLAERLVGSAGPQAYRATPFRGTPRHLQTVEQCIGHIRAGDIFQVNAALRLDAGFRGSTVDLFADASDRLRPAYASYVDTSAAVLVGLSPELFLRRRGRTVLTSPIKGTRPRTGVADEVEAEILRRSTKDAAENVMIVDLMRNDLGRVCLPGSVRAPALLEIQPHPGVWHLVSSVSAELAPDVGDAELLAATFPPGSVTGAPKTRAIQIIDAYEPAPRSAFTGAVGFSSPVYGAEFSVTIRSFEISGDRISLWVGGGITVDSVPIEERRECLVKARPLLAAAGFELDRAESDVDSPAGSWADSDLPELSAGLLETVLLRHGRAIGLADHLARLDRSCRELYGQQLPADLAARVAGCAAGQPDGRLRIIARPEDDRLDVSVTVAPVHHPTGVPRLVAMPRPAGVWRHKYADRRWLTAAEGRCGDGVLPLFVDAGCALETSRGNIFRIEGGTLVTPELTDAILPGVTRRLVLDVAFDLGVPVRIEPVPLAGIACGDGLFTTSAISEVTHIDELDGQPLPPPGPLESRLRAALAGRH